MIHVKDLRIGNWVSYNNKTIKVEMILNNWIESNYSPFGYIEFEKLVGIPLTHDLLLNFGFDKNGKNADFSKQVGNNLDLVINLEDEICGFALNWKDGFVCQWKHIKYVHELQNLYYFTSNEELDIKI